MIEEDGHHVVWYCSLYEDLLQKMTDGICSKTVGPVCYPDLRLSGETDDGSSVKPSPRRGRIVTGTKEER